MMAVAGRDNSGEVAAPFGVAPRRPAAATLSGVESGDQAQRIKNLLRFTGDIATARLVFR
jgi:hypothetical protein